MYKENRRGPSTEPWGDSGVKGAGSEHVRLIRVGVGGRRIAAGKTEEVMSFTLLVK